MEFTEEAGERCATLDTGAPACPSSRRRAWKQDARGTWRTKIDVKSHRAYVVAPGSHHKTGLVYTASTDIRGFFDGR